MGYADGLNVKRHTKEKNNLETIACPRSQRDYVIYFNDVDKNDHNSSFYLTIIQKIRYYLRIFFWALDRVVHTLFAVACYLNK